jgi:hypothetical protein
MAHTTETIEQLARQVRNTLDAFLEKLQGGDGVRTLIDARVVLSSYIQREKVQAEKPLTIQMPSVGGVTLVRGGQAFTIRDEELEIVRDTVNTRKREIRKRERLDVKAKKK